MASILQLHCVLLGESSDQRKRVPGSALKAYFDIIYHAAFFTTQLSS
jgi:hypothetical protein